VRALVVISERLLEWSGALREAGVTPIVFNVLFTLWADVKNVCEFGSLKACASVGDKSAGYEALRFPVVPDVGDPAGLNYYCLRFFLHVLNKFLNKRVLNDPYTHTRIAITFRLIPNDGAADRRQPTIHRVIWEPPYQVNRCGKAHAPG
jgi:hypothetical protein